MSEITTVFQNSPSFNNPSFETEFIFLADINSVKYTVFCSADCEFGFRWAVDNQFQGIATDTYSLSAGTEQSILVPITARYCQFFVNNIASLPGDLKTQAFFLTKFRFRWCNW